jgi:hypothetical protein
MFFFVSHNNCGGTVPIDFRYRQPRGIAQMTHWPCVQFCRQTSQLQDHRVSIQRYRTLRLRIRRERDQSERERSRDKCLMPTEIKLIQCLFSNSI